MKKQNKTQPRNKPSELKARWTFNAVFGDCPVSGCYVPLDRYKGLEIPDS